jgi:hypothetical protein
VSIYGIGIDNRIIEPSQLVTTSKDYALTVLHTSQISTGHTRSSQSVRVFTSRCLLVAFKGERSLSSGFPNCPRPQLPASHSNSSQLNPIGYLTHPLTHQQINVSLIDLSLVLFITFRHGLHRNHRSFVAVYGLLTSNGRLSCLQNSWFDLICYNILFRSKF